MTSWEQGLIPMPESGPEAGPARTSPSPDDGLEWVPTRELGPRSSGSSTDSLTPYGLPGWWPRMFPAPSPLEADETGDLPSVRWSTAGMASLGGFSTHSTSESPNDGAVSSLLRDVLLDPSTTPRDWLEKYSLSSKACVGILRRAQRRSRKLPPALHAALSRVPRENLAKAIREGDEERIAAEQAMVAEVEAMSLTP